MAMLGKTDERTGNGPGTVIGSNVKLIGALRDGNDVTVHGTIEGEVASDKNVVIGETAQVKGPVNGTIVSIAGVVNGSVEASQRLELLATGKIFGNIITPDLIVHSGAIFVGKSEMSNGEHKVETQEEPAPAKKPDYEVE